MPPVMLIEQTPPRHENPALHATPPQHVSPLPPHGAGMPPESMVQVPRWHESIELHAVPPQQGCIASPQGVGIPLPIRQVPMSQLRPGLHAVPQHI
jgi:hypothetical protein